MRVAVLSGNAPRRNAVGNQIAEKVRFFQERGAEVRVFVQDARRLHPDLSACCTDVAEVIAEGPVWDYLRQTDLIFAVYAQYHDLLQYLPCLAGAGPRIVFDYLGVTPPSLWHAANREGLEQSARQRGYVWCADHALTTSQANHRELLGATQFAPEHVATLPLVVDVERFAACGLALARRHANAKPQAVDHFWQARLGIDGRVLLYVGRIAGNKRVPLLIEALARLNDPSIHVVMVGDVSDVYAAEAERCMSLAEELGVAERVHFAGQIDDRDLSAAYRGADVLVMPSLHEGFCLPVLEAMASGLPVIASRSAALPETVGAAGLTFRPDDAEDLARQIRRVLNRAGSVSDGHVKRAEKRRIAVVSFRIGPDIVGGAETSLRTMANALQDAGHHVEVFTTCACTESHWQTDLPAGTTTLDGLTVHRFPIAPHNSAAHGETVRAIMEADGQVNLEVGQRYLQQSIHAPALIATFQKRRDEFDAVITGPYLFGLTADVAAAMPDKTLLVPCFHDEALARLDIWPDVYGAIGGVLYHSRQEQEFAQTHLGINHPNARVIGTCVTSQERKRRGEQSQSRRLRSGLVDNSYIVYCGRHSDQKNVPLLIEWARRYQSEHRLDVVFMGQGNVKLPRESWLHDLGYVDEETKREVLAGARALVQLSTQESLSLVALEAWAEGTPIIVHRECAVLVGQIEQSQGGVAVGDYAEFAAALDGLCRDEVEWRRRGANGRAYVNGHYASPLDYVTRLIEAIEQFEIPIGDQMRARGLERAQEFRRERWQGRFAEFVEQVLTQPVRSCRELVTIEPLRAEARTAAGTRTLLLPVRLTNAGTHAAVPDGPGRTVVCCTIHDDSTGAIVIPRQESAMPILLTPGKAQVAALPIPLPADVGEYRIRLWAQRDGTTPGSTVEVPLTIDSAGGCTPVAPGSPTVLSAFLDTVRETLPETHRLQQLPDEYLDVTEGTLAPAKRWVKRKLLHNFKHAYVDVLSRRQSQVNGQVVLMIQQLAECCAMLDHAVSGLHQRLDALEARLDAEVDTQVHR